MRIAISGPPGSGKTTVSELVAKSMGYELLLVGQIFREMASERGIDLEMFDALAEEDETIDKELDIRVMALAMKKEDIVIEGRLTAALMKRKEIPALSVYIDAAEEVRASRIAKREGKPADAVLKDMQIRERSEKKRYKAYYGIDVSDRFTYDLWLESDDKSPQELADIIVAEARGMHDEEARQV